MALREDFGSVRDGAESVREGYESVREDFGIVKDGAASVRDGFDSMREDYECERWL